MPKKFWPDLDLSQGMRPPAMLFVPGGPVAKHPLQHFIKNGLQILEDYREDRKLAYVARCCDIHPNRLSEILNGKRELTEYYLGKLLTGGLVTKEQLLGGRKREDLTPEEKRFLDRFELDNATMDMIGELKDRGVNLRGLLALALGKEQDKE